MKDVYKNCLAIVLVETICIFGAFGFVNAIISHHVKSQLEEYVDEEIQRPIVDDDAKRRQERIVRFKEINRSVRNSWDQYDQQFPLFDTISFYENLSSPEIAQVRYRPVGYPKQELRIKFTNMHSEAGPSSLVHEMAHAWHNTLSEKKAFEKEWKQIAGDGYTNDPKYPETSCSEPMERVATVSCYGATNMNEDIATTVEKVYELKTEPDFMTEEASRIEEKIRLAAAYKFFSESERDNALGKIIKVYPFQIAGSEK